MYMHVYIHTHVWDKSALLPTFKIWFFWQRQGLPFYKDFIFRQLLADKMETEQSVWTESFPACCKTIRGQKPEIFHIALRIYVKKKSHFSSPSLSFMELNLAPSYVNLAWNVSLTTQHFCFSPFLFALLLPRCFHAAHFSCGIVPVERWDFILDRFGQYYYTFICQYNQNKQHASVS